MVVGCGAIGVSLEDEPDRPKPGTHAGAFSAHKKVELVALVDIDKKKLRTALKKYPRAKGYTSVAAALRAERPDIVAIATGPSSHVKIVHECVKAKVAMIICEKPLAHSMKDARRIQQLVEKSASVFVVNYQRRFYPLIAAVRDDIRKGTLGRLQQVSCFYSNGLYNNGGHLIDTLQYLLEDRIVAARGSVNTRNKTHPKGDSNIDCMLSTSGGTTIAMQSFDQNVYGTSEVRLFGERGAVFIREYGFTVVRVALAASHFKGLQQLDYKHGRTVTQPLSAVSGALEHAIGCHEKKRRPVSSAESAAEVVRVLDAISSDARKKVRTVY